MLNGISRKGSLPYNTRTKGMIQPSPVWYILEGLWGIVRSLFRGDGDVKYIIDIGFDYG